MGCGSLACWPSRQAHPSQRTGISEEGYSVAVVTCECSAYLLTSPDASESVGLLACLSASGLGARTGVARNQQLPSIAGMCAVHACFDGWFLLPTLLLLMLPPDMLTASMNALEAHEMLAESVRFEHTLHTDFITHMFKQVGEGVRVQRGNNCSTCGWFASGLVAVSLVNAALVAFRGEHLWTTGLCSVVQQGLCSVLCTSPSPPR